MRKNNVTNVYITTGVMKTYKSTKKLEESCERNKWSGIHGAVSEIR
jgi:hypothetical protein